jgi:phosphohistidine phosphatase SixA
LLLAGGAPAQSSSTDWISALRAGGYVIVIRHGATNPDQADTDPFNLQNVDKQRQLNDQGRALARQIGDAMRRLKIPVGEVRTSQFFRAQETGKLLGFGDVVTTADITEGGLVVSPNENNRRAAAFKKLAATVPPAGTNVVLVSHKPNILDAFGKDWFDVREGEASIFKPDGNGGFTLVARVQAADWSKLAATGGGNDCFSYNGQRFCQAAAPGDAAADWRRAAVPGGPLHCFTFNSRRFCE